MLVETLQNTINVQEKLLSSLKFEKVDETRKLLQNLVNNSDNLLFLSSKNKLFLDFTTLFSPEAKIDLKSDELVHLSNELFTLAREFCQKSQELKSKVESALVKGSFSDRTSKDVSSVEGLFRFKTPELETRILDAFGRISLSMDIGGTFIKVFFKLKLESPDLYDFLKYVYSGYLNSLYLVQHWPFSNGTHYNLDPGHGNSSQVLDFFNSVFLSFRLNEDITLFKYVPAAHLDYVISTIKGENLHDGTKTMNVTGGGAFKFKDLLLKEFKLVSPKDELTCCTQGVGFIHSMEHSAVVYDLVHRLPKFTTLELVYPYIIAAVGSGTSFLKVDSESEFQRVFGTSISGGTAFGLVNYLLPLDHNRTFFKFFKSGNNSLDYFTKYPSRAFSTSNKSEPYGLYCSLGNLESKGNDVNPEDLNKSIVDMISYNTGCLGYILGKIFEAKRVFFVGNYLCNYTMESIAAGFTYQSDLYDDKSIQLCFPLHGPFMNAIGCFLKD